jgi:hypothetical protein
MAYCSPWSQLCSHFGHSFSSQTKEPLDAPWQPIKLTHLEVNCAQPIHLNKSFCKNPAVIRVCKLPTPHQGHTAVNSRCSFDGEASWIGFANIVATLNTKLSADSGISKDIPDFVFLRLSSLCFSPDIHGFTVIMYQAKLLSEHSLSISLNNLQVIAEYDNTGMKKIKMERSVSTQVRNNGDVLLVSGQREERLTVNLFDLQIKTKILVLFFPLRPFKIN